MKCPRCGYHRQKSDDNFVPASECPSCGIVYSKHHGDAAYPISDEPEQSAAMLKPSPVDAESLKKARDRVDQRLNERLANQVKDTRHDKTLALARQFASEGVRKRQEQWRQQEAEELEKAELKNPVDGSSDSAPVNAANDNDTEHNHASTPVASAETLESKADENLDLPLEADGQTQRVEPSNTQEDDQAAKASISKVTSVARAMDKQHLEPGIKKTNESQNGAAYDASTVLYMEEDFENTAAATWYVPPQKASSDDETEPTLTLKAALNEQPQTTEEPSLSGLRHQRKRWRWIPGDGLSRLLPLVAWLILIAGISGAILSWTTMAEAEAGMLTQQLTGNAPLPMGLLLGFAYLVIGVLGFAFFWVSSLISRQLKDIRRLLILQPITAIGDINVSQAEAHSDD